MTESDPDPRQPCAAIILAAGREERMRSRRAAVLHPLAGRPLAYYPVRASREAGCAPVVVACVPDSATVRNCLDSAAVCVAEKGAGLLEAALAAIPDTVRAVMVVPGVMPLLSSETLSRLARRQHETSGSLVSLTALSQDDPVRIADGPTQICRQGGELPSPWPSSQGEGASRGGAVCVSRAWLWERRHELPELRNDFLGSSDDVVAALAALALDEGESREAVCLAGGASELLRVADRTDLARAEGVLRQRIRERALRGGVTLADPTTVWIDDTVTFGQDVTVLPNCHLYGATHIGDNCTIGPSSRLQDTQLAANVTVMESVLEGAVVGENARIGPFAHLRPGAVVEHDVEIGNYAELKNTRVCAGAKIHHVGYLGDTVVGSGANIGAGTITCNYDGAEKHETEIGGGAFIGSGTLLVAPVRVGDKAMTGAGSVVTRDVPPASKAYGVPARVRGTRGPRADTEQAQTDERKDA